MNRFVFNSNLTNILIIALSVILINLAVWLPHILKVDNFYNLNFSEGFNNIYRNFDGLEYVIIAKTFYFPENLKQIPQSLPEKYYAAHFPLYSLIILLFAPFIGFLKSMIFVSTLFTFFSGVIFYLLVKNFDLSRAPLWLTLVFLCLPARWLIVHSVGSSEPVFIFFALCSIYFFLKYEQSKKWTDIHLAGIFGLFTQLTRPPGILLFITFGIYIIFKIFSEKQDKIKSFFKAFLSYHPLVLILLGLLAVFYWYQISFNDFFAYFHSGDNIHLSFPPFQVFNKNEFWVGEIWLEDIVYIFILGFLAATTLFKQKNYLLSFFVFVYLASCTLISHRDIARYALPVFPFVLIAFEKVLVSREFKVVLAIVILGVYLYTQNFLIHNTAPFPNLESFN